MLVHVHVRRDVLPRAPQPVIYLVLFQSHHRMQHSLQSLEVGHVVVFVAAATAVVDFAVVDSVVAA